ncbi:MAG: YlmC/YmxH family sporulation protein [Clostridiales bacterium]|nr:YlmC/YmxH family sporulation protein [Clostridiales bacterium]
MLFSDFKKKEVINLKNCEKLGRVTDFEFDECTGQIFKLIIGGGNKFCGLLGGESESVISYKDIKQIGPDIIIVDICRK